MDVTRLDGVDSTVDIRFQCQFYDILHLRKYQALLRLKQIIQQHVGHILYNRVIVNRPHYTTQQYPFKIVTRRFIGFIKIRTIIAYVPEWMRPLPVACSTGCTLTGRRRRRRLGTKPHDDDDEDAERHPMKAR